MSSCIFRDQAGTSDDITVKGDGEQTSDDAVGEAFNVGTGESITIRELAKTI